MSMSARDISQRIMSSQAKNIVRGYTQDPEFPPPNISAIRITFSISACDESVNMFMDEWNNAAQGTSLENMPLETYTHLQQGIGCDDVDAEIIYNEPEKKRGLFDFIFG